MNLKSTPVSPKRNRVTVHASGELHPLTAGSAILKFAPNAERMFYVEFDVRDLKTLKKIVADLSKAKEKSK